MTANTTIFLGNHAYAARPTGKHSLLGARHTWRAPRRECTGPASHRDRLVLHPRPGLSRLHPSARHYLQGRRLHHQEQKQHPISADLLPSRGSQYWTLLRPDCHARPLLCTPELFRQAAPCQVCRSRNRQAFCLPDQQLNKFGHYGSRPLSRCRWQVELFFRWLKQHLQIKAFYGTSENAVFAQIWIALSVYVLVVIMKKKLLLTVLSLYTILQILSVLLFEKKPILTALVPQPYTKLDSISDN
jgi:hypothetical protein